MGNKQLLAQVCVFVLLGVNVAAYYVFWPKGDHSGVPDPDAGGHETVVRTPAKAKKDHAPVAPLAPVSVEKLPVEISSTEVPRVSVPLAIALPPQMPATLKKSPEADAVRLLMEHIRKERGLTADDPSAAALRDLPLPPPVKINADADSPSLVPLTGSELDKERGTAPPRVDPSAPRLLPPFQVLPPPIPLPTGEGKNSTPSPLALTADLAARMPNSPWLVNVEIVGTLTVLHVRLRNPAPHRARAEFKIQCDAVDAKSPDGALQAVGQVTFAGAGMKGSCQRLTLAVNASRMVLEGQVRISHEAPTFSLNEKKGDFDGSALPRSVLQGDKIVWDIHAETTATTDIQPAAFRPATFDLPTPAPTATLGPPKSFPRGPD